MAHPRHSEDTLFIVSEGDFRFTARDAQDSHRRACGEPDPAAGFSAHGSQGLLDVDYMLNEWQKYAPEGNVWGDPVTEPPAEHGGPAHGRASSSTAEASGVAVPHVDRVCFRKHPLKRPPGKGDERPTDYLVDLQAYATLAHRLGRGNLIWCGWNASHFKKRDKKKRTTHPSTGAQLLMVTTQGARLMLKEWLELPDSHMGGFIASYSLKNQERVGCCYILRPIGGFFTHNTGCSGPSGVVLESLFGAEWSQEGTRPGPAPNNRGRWLCAFTPKGHASRLHPEPIMWPQGLEETYWVTEAPAGTPARSLGFLPHHAPEEAQQWRPMRARAPGRAQGPPPPHRQPPPTRFCHHRTVASPLATGA